MLRLRQKQPDKRVCNKRSNPILYDIPNHKTIKMRNLSLYFAAYFILSGLMSNAQEKTDSLRQKQLDEVVIIGKFDFTQKQKKTLSSLDSYLEKNNAINMLKRGAYAWEPLVNGMATERSIITIDGMRIYGACTDKMDPVTSYVEITNLSRANIQSGQAGAKHGATIAGSIDLVRSHSDFSNNGFNGMLFSGLESNNMQKIMGSKFQYTAKNFYQDIDFTWRNAQDYKAGGGQKIQFSQFSKYNLSANTGLKINEHQSLSASLIYDKATDIGYPALPMDVSSAEAIIGSLEFNYHLMSEYFHQWESKIYYNQVTHVMDDTQRPTVAIHMDMPGWSKTAGFYSNLSGKTGKHHFKLNLSGHYNNALAEMTMYSNISSQPDMFMFTWPGVETYFSNIFIEDSFQLNEQLTAKMTIGSSLNYNEIGNQFGYESLKIFYPNLSKGKLRWLNNMGFNLGHQSGKWINNFGIAYGERASSVTEGYGFYLFNSMDQYDYVGNPNLKNEKSFELSISSNYNLGQGFIKLQSSYFNVYDYIIGIPQSNLIAMTIGAKGIKIYEQLPRASLFNLALSSEFPLHRLWNMSGKVQYRYGEVAGIALPQIQPLSYGLNLKYKQKILDAEISMEGAAKQRHYGIAFGENPAQAYTVFNVSVAKQLQWNNKQIQAKTGIENITDRHYRTFSDWNNIPRMGRNFYLNVIYKF